MSKALFIFLALFNCGCSRFLAHSMIAGDAEKQAAHDAIEKETQWIMRAEMAGDIKEAQSRAKRLRAWCNTIPDYRKRAAYLYWVDIWDSILEKDLKVAAIRKSMPIPPSLDSQSIGAARQGGRE